MINNPDLTEKINKQLKEVPEDIIKEAVDETLESKIKCCECDSDYEENYYVQDDKIYCKDCLLEKLEDEGHIHTTRITSYFNDDWHPLGNDDDEYELMQNVCDEFDINRIEGDE